MKGVVLLGDRKAEVREFPVPEPGPSHALVRMTISSICGTDMHFYRKSWDELASMRKKFNGSPDTIPCHEPTGVVEAVGSAVTSVKPGDRVNVYQHVGCETCGYCRQGDVMFCPDRTGYGSVHNGSAADYMLAPEFNCLRIPDSLSDDRAVVLSCAGGTAYQSVKRLNPSGADTVAIFGLGPVGLSAVAFAAARGARVIGVDMIEERRDLASSMGARDLIDPAASDPVEAIMDLTGGVGAEAGADYSGNPQAQEAMLASAAKGARVAIVGVGDSFKVDTQFIMIMKQLTILGSWIYNIGLFDEMAHFVVEKDLPLEKLITHRYSIDQGAEAFEVFDSGKTGKVAFTWDN